MADEWMRPTPYADVNAILRELMANVQPILADRFVGMYLYGSLAAGDFSPETSDIDFLVEMDNGRSLLDLIELSQDLETLLQRKVDVLTDKGLSPYLEQGIHAEAVLL